MSAAEASLPGSALHAIIEALPEPVVVADMDGRIVVASRRATELLGRDMDAMRGSPLAALIPARCVDALLHAGSASGADGAAAEQDEAVQFAGQRPDGSSFLAEVRAARVAGPWPFLAAALRDVTPAQRAPGMSADMPLAPGMTGRRLVAAASHDLRQPLQTLRMLNGSLNDAATAPQLREIVAQQARTLEAMGRLVDALLDIGRLDAGMVRPEPQDVDLAGLLGELGREFAPLAREGGVALHVEARVAGARTDPVLLGQVLRNLVANALKFAPRGEVRLSCRADGAHALVEVADDGIGIPAQDIGRIFDEFYRVPARHEAPARDGHGLGLAIVRRLVDLLGIALSVESKPGAGTRFRLSMPRATLPAAQGAAAGRRPRAPAFARAHRVLLLEDDPGLRHASRRWLAARGLDVEAAATGAEALRIAADGFAPDLVICDLHLADGENGVDALQRLRAAQGRVLPALLLSGDSSEAARALARVEGVEMLLKPVDPDELLAVLRGLLEGPPPAIAS